MLSTRMGKTDDSVAYKESGTREASGTRPSVWGVMNYFGLTTMLFSDLINFSKTEYKQTKI